MPHTMSRCQKMPATVGGEAETGESCDLKKEEKLLETDSKKDRVIITRV